MTLRGRTGALIGAAIVASAALAAFSFHLRFSRIGPARDRLDLLSETIARERTTAARRPGLENEKARLEARTAEFREALPEGEDLETLRRSLRDDAARAGVLLTAVRPSPVSELPGAVEEVSVAVEARGDFAALGRFLDLVESQRRAVILDQFELRPDGEVAASLPEVIPSTLALRLTAYRVREAIR